MTTYEKSEALKDALYQEQITYGEFVSRLSEIQAECMHDSKEVYVDDNDYYVTCKDCGEDL